MFAGSDYFRHLSALNDDSTEISIKEEPLADKDTRKDCTSQSKGQIKRQKYVKDQYTQEQLQLAYEAVQSGISLYRACQLYGIPRNTLRYRLKNTTSNQKLKPGPKAYLSNSQELTIVKQLHALADAGFVITHRLIRCFATEYVKANIDQFPTGNPFPTGQASHKWATLFVSKKHPDLTKHVTENWSKYSVSSLERVSVWFNSVSKYLKRAPLQAALRNRRHVFTLDDVELKRRKSDTTFTCLFGASAHGKLLPPLVLYPESMKLPSQKKQSELKYAVAQQDTDLNAGNVFYQWLSRVFEPWLIEENVPRPVILFIDGNRHKMGYLSSNFCQQHHIVLVSLLPLKDHMLRPLNDQLFESIRKLWYEEIQTLDRGRFSSIDPLLKPVLDKLTNTEDIIRDGFLRSKMYPWNPEGNMVRKTVDPMLALFRRTLDSRLTEQELAGFQAHRSDEAWQGPVEHTSLFHVWLDLQKEIDGAESDVDSAQERDRSYFEPELIAVKQEDTGDYSQDFVKEEPISDNDECIN